MMFKVLIKLQDGFTVASQENVKAKVHILLRHEISPVIGSTKLIQDTRIMVLFRRKEAPFLSPPFSLKHILLKSSAFHVVR